jgi:hypothetical protein
MGSDKSPSHVPEDVQEVPRRVSVAKVMGEGGTALVAGEMLI